MSTELEFYALVEDPYEQENRIRRLMKQKMATLWNAWNQDNESIALLQSYEYQKERIQFYTERYRRLKEQAISVCL